MKVTVMNDFNTNLSFEIVSRSKENFVSIYNKMFEELISRDMGGIISRANCRLMDNKRIKLSFFKKEIIVDLNKKKIYFLKSWGSDEEPLDMYSSSLILHYLLNADGTPPANNWISYRELPGGLFYWQTIPKVLEPLIKKYENNGEGFLKKTFEIGGGKYAQFKFGSVIYPFKMFPVLMIFDEKSTEFEANIRVLFDGSAHHYLKTDVVKLIIIYIVKKLCNQ
jgi:hypothetical protein